MNRSGIMVVLLLVACVVLLPYTWGGLVWDDHILLTEGLWKEGSVSSIWMQSVQGGEIASQYYRPIPMTIFALVQSITMLHTIALLVHVGSTWLLSEWLHSRFEQAGVVYLGALLFALHPIQTEVLGWASCLPDILAVHFGLWSVMFAVKERSAWWTAGALLCGLLSKEIALLPLLAFGLDECVSDHRKNKRWSLPSWAVPVGLVLLLVVTLRMVFQVKTVLPTSFDSVARTTFVTIGMGWFSWLVPFPHYPVRDVCFTDVVSVCRVGVESSVLVDHSQPYGVADCDGWPDCESPTGMGGVFCCRTISICSKRWICMADLYGDFFESLVTTVDQRCGVYLDTVNGGHPLESSLDLVQ